MTSPYFDDINPLGYYYYNNLNCTWLLKADQGSYVNFEIDFFRVKSDTAGPCVTQPQNNVTPKNYNALMTERSLCYINQVVPTSNTIILLNDNHFSFHLETTYHSLMEEICNLNRSKNLIRIPI